MPEEEQNFSAAMRAARRSVWEQAKAAGIQSDEMRAARRSVWEQAKAAGIQNDETLPPVPTGKETGFNDDPRIARLEGIVRDLAGRLDDLEDDYPESEIGNGVGGGGSIYSSYFRVINASTTDPYVCKIGVTSGGNTVSGICGAVKINGDRVYVTAVKKTLSSDGVYYVWIHSWIDAEDGPNAEIIVGGATPPDNPNSGIAFASQLAGRVTVLDGAIASITQDYLAGGEHTELLFGDCEGGEIQVTP
jgi:hypothetical protein